MNKGQSIETPFRKLEKMIVKCKYLGAFIKDQEGVSTLEWLSVALVVVLTSISIGLISFDQIGPEVTNLGALIPRVFFALNPAARSFILLANVAALGVTTVILHTRSTSSAGPIIPSYETVERTFHTKLVALAQSDSFAILTKTTYGERLTDAQVEAFRKRIIESDSTGDWSWLPKAQYVGDRVLMGHLGAYAPKLKQILINKTKSDEEQQRIYEEEVEHAIAEYINGEIDLGRGAMETARVEAEAAEFERKKIVANKRAKKAADDLVRETQETKRLLEEIRFHRILLRSEKGGSYPNPETIKDVEEKLAEFYRLESKVTKRRHAATSRVSFWEKRAREHEAEAQQLRDSIA